MTVLGPIDPNELGFTQTHEHLICDLSKIVGHAEVDASDLRRDDLDVELDAATRGRTKEPVTPQNYDWIRRNVVNVDNLTMLDEDLSTHELARFHQSGGRSIVESTPIGLGRSPAALARISRATGVNVIMGSGFYTQNYHPSTVAGASEEQIEEFLVREAFEGVRGTGIRPGVIGEVGLSTNPHPDEVKVLRAAVRAQVRTGLPVQIHPGRTVEGPFDAMQIVEDAGGDPTRTIMSHIDRTISELADMVRLAKTGCYLEFDLFGQESSYYAFSDFDRPNDAGRLSSMAGLMREGYRERLLIAQDICQKVYLSHYGGPGYTHILENVIPDMKRKGWTRDDINQLVIDNPREALTVIPGSDSP
ncbi:phosphotriesterase [Microbacterium sp. AGC85]